MTKEHTWAAWLENILPDRGPITYYRANQVAGGEPEIDRWRGKDFDHTVAGGATPAQRRLSGGIGAVS